MSYQGKAISCQMLADNIVEMKFDLQGESVNKFNKLTLTELAEATKAIAASGAAGVVVTSGKEGFIVGADITEFGSAFSGSEADLLAWCAEANAIFSGFEDLNMPTVVAINGIALGGGFEMCLSADYRVMSTKAEIGLPEVKLGIYPGFGGTVRLPRLIGADNAIEWIAGGTQQKPDAALKAHAVDAVVAPEKVRDAAIDLVKRAIAGEFNWQARRAQKKGPLMLAPMESMMAFETAKGFIAGKAGKHYPAPVEAVKAIQKAAGKSRDGALLDEAKGFVKVARTTVASSLIGLFLNDQVVKKKSKDWSKQSAPIKQAAVLGAGIMGGGIAYQSAVKGTPIIMKDIADKALDLGMNEATKLLGKQVERKKIDAVKMGAVLSSIRPTLNYGDFGGVDIIVEAVVENPKIKKAVLGEVEGLVREDTIIASNTSTISIDLLAADLKRPENFLGMHFFNPVHMMPLVEVIRGSKTSDKAIATTVAYAQKMGKTPIVVRDCPGFLVNRVLFPYFAGFQMLMAEGADFVQVDKVMESFGWPMGPAYLLDVVGIDTAHHAQAVMAAGFPDRMANSARTTLDVMYDNKRFGQKNGLGYYAYAPDKKGKPKKAADPAVAGLIADVVPPTKAFTEEEIIDRMMLPLILEVIRCLEENIVDSAAEADLALIYGIGFPPFRGGALKYASDVGLANILAKAEKYAPTLGKLYEPTAGLRALAAEGKRYY